MTISPFFRSPRTSTRSPSAAPFRTSTHSARPSRFLRQTLILTAGSPDALSFTDDTSLPNAGAKVPIHAQVIRELPLDWYYALLQRTPSHASELKSTVILDTERY